MAELDKTSLINSVENYADSLWDKTLDNLKTKMVEEAESKDVSKDLLNTLKANVDLQDYPDDVYYTVMDEIVENKDETVTTTTKKKSSNIFKKIANWFEDVFDSIFSKKTRSLIVDGLTYLVAGAIGKTVTLAKITVSGVDHILNWTGVTDNDHTVSDFIDDVIDAGTDYCKSLWRKISQSSTGELVTNWLESLVGKNDHVSDFISTLQEVYSDINQDNYKTKLVELTAEVFADNSSTISNLTNKYTTLVEKVDALKNGTDISAVSDSYKNFVDSYNDLASALGTSGISYDTINEFISDNETDSRDVFLYADGDGDVVLDNFKAGSSDNSDVIYLQGSLGEINREGNVVTVNGASGGALTIETDFSTDEAILYTIDGENIGAAKLADSTNTLYYDKNVYYFRFNDNAGKLYYWGGEDMTIALDNSTTPQEYIGLKSIITRSDTEKASGNLTLIGNDLDNEIYSGAGNDTLTGGAGADTFYWGSGDGNDLITDAESSDVIDLYNVSLSDIAEVTSSDNSIGIKLNDGAQLEVQGTDATFKFSDSSRYKYQSGWQQQA